MSNYYRPGGMGFSFFPPVIKNLLIINGVVFLLQLVMQGLTFQGIPGAYIVDHWFALNPIGNNFQIWQLITYQFMHGSFTHILFNMFALWMFGIEIENLWGSKKFLYYYLLCGVAAGLFQILLTPLLTGLAARFVSGTAIPTAKKCTEMRFDGVFFRVPVTGTLVT